MFGAAGYVDFCVADQARQRAGDEAARVARRRNIGIVEHGVAVAAQAARRASLRLGEQGDDARALVCRQLT